MSGEFAALIDEFVSFGEVYAANAKQIAPNVELRRVAEIYEVGMKSAMKGASQILSEQYRGIRQEEKDQLDLMVVLHGALDMIQAANERFKESFLLLGDALAKAGGIIEKIKNILRRILDIEEGSFLDKILDTIDEILENFFDLFSGPDKPKKNRGQKPQKPFNEASFPGKDSVNK
jgi:hypothetical protein